MPIDSGTQVLLIAIIALVGIAVLITFIQKLNRFLSRLRYIDMEINRNSGESRAFWLKKRKKLWLTWIPFYRG